MSLCLCTSALDFYVCDLPHCVSGVCGHMNHLFCPKQASVQAQRQQPQCQCGGHHLPVMSTSQIPRTRDWDHEGGSTCVGYTGTTVTALHKEGVWIFLRYSPSTLYFSWTCLPPLVDQALLVSFSIVSNLCWKLQMWIPKLLGFPNPCADPVWIQLSQIFCCESEQERQYSAFRWQQCC